VALAFILVAVVIFFTVFTGIRQVDRKLVERIVTLGGNRWDLLRHVYLPSVAAWVLGNLKVAVGFAFTGAVVGEFVGASAGLGYRLNIAAGLLDTKRVYLILLILMVFAVTLVEIAKRVEARLLRWRPAATLGA
jgi:NitT/TauT family transport system permease protein